jgi:7-cyano-7-deazaguanine synthase
VNATAVLLSAGLDSAVLLASEAQRAPVHPIYVSAGLAWEREERAMAGRLLQTPLFRNVKPLVTLDFTARDLYEPSHWALRGTPPAFDTPDSDVYLPGRNVMLVTKVAIYCAQHGISRIALGPLAANPFPDATPAFFGAISTALTLGLAQPIEVVTPFAHMHKADVIRAGIELGVPLELTLSCMEPRRGRHCGRCSKCRERRDAFAAAHVTDPARFAVTTSR